MSQRRWNVTVLAIACVVAAATAAINYHANFYGLFGDAAGKEYVVYDNEKATKYLFSYNYIPRNFDGMLIGTSASDNWNTGELSGIRMYNASLNGGNISEETLIANQVLERSRPRLVLFLIHPYLTESYGRKSGFMNPQEYWGGLGSLQLLRAYARSWLVERGYLRREFNEFGAHDFIVRPPPAQAQAVVEEPSFFVDPRALEQYRKLMERVRAGGARIAGVIPPIEMKVWKVERPAFLEYYSKIRPFFRQDEPIIDLNAPEMDEFRSNAENYQDPVHLASQATHQVVRMIETRLKKAGLF